MLIYLAAPMESGSEVGEQFRGSFIYIISKLECNGVAIYEPSRPFWYNGEAPAEPVRTANRAVLRNSTVVAALLAGCETWREIEHAIECGVPVLGAWPKEARRSPVAEHGITVCDNIDVMVDLCLKMR